MIKYIIFFLLLLVITPYAYLAGFGFLNNMDVPSGLEMFTKSFYDDVLVYEGETVADDEITTERKTVRWNGEVESETLAEASGLAASYLNDDVLFSINDSGHKPRLYALGVDGSDLGSWPIEFRERHDFEDMAAFRLDGKAYLLIADTGDNFNWRRQLTLVVLEEPDITTLNSETILKPSWTFSFSYPDGYRDSEGIAVDEETRSIMLVSKRRVPAEIFTLPLKPDANHVVAQPIARLKGIPQPTPRDLREDSEYGYSRSMPTAMDIRGRKAMVVTYKDAYLFARDRRESWADAFSSLPVRIPLPDMNGLESGAFSSNGRQFFVTGEREDGVGRAGVFEVDL
jgi:hypothetical protein